MAGAIILWIKDAGDMHTYFLSYYTFKYSNPVTIGPSPAEIFLNSLPFLVPPQIAMHPSHSTSPLGASSPRLALVSTHELVKKDHQRELERIVQSSERVPMNDYATYVMLPLFLLMAGMIAVRKVFAL